MESKVYRDSMGSGYTISTHISALENAYTGKDILQRAAEKVASALAEQFLADHAQEVLKHLDPQAVANLAIADAAGAIRETLHKKLPYKILKVVERDTALGMLSMACCLEMSQMPTMILAKLLIGHTNSLMP